MKAKVIYIADVALLLVLALIFFWRDLTPKLADRWTFIPGDFVQQTYAPARYAALRLQNGQIPSWNPFNYAGHPFVADIQNAVFYPPRLLTMLVSSREGFSYRALELEALAHFLLVAIFTYLLARRLTCSRLGGLTAAIVFTFGGYLTSYPLLQLGILEVQTWLPLILLCVELAAEKLESGVIETAFRWGGAAGLVAGVSLLAGHPQSSLLVLYAVLAFGMFRLWPRPFTRNLAYWRRVGGLLAMIVLLGLGVAAVQLLPSAELATRSIRSAITFEEAGQGFLPYDLLQIIWPAIGGRFPVLYVGILPLGLTTLALTVVRTHSATADGSRRLIVFLGGSLLLSVLISFGKHLGLYQLLYLLAPGWQLFRQQERAIVWAVFAVALLSGFGATWLSWYWLNFRSGSTYISGGSTCPESGGLGADANAVERTFVQRLISGYDWATLVAAVLVLIFFVGYQAGSKELWGFASASTLMVVLLFLTALALRSRRPVALLAVLVLDLFTITPKSHAIPLSKLELFPFHSLVGIPLADKDVFRVYNDDALPSNLGPLYGLEDTRGASQLELGLYDQWLKRVPAARAWQLLNVRYVFSWQQTLDAPAERLAEEPDPDKDNKPVYLYRLLQTGPRAWLAGQILVEPDPARAIERLSSPDFEATKQIVLTAIPSGFSDVADCGGTIVWTKRDPEQLSLQVVTDHTCILVLSEIDYPGWRATIDGADVPILKADVILRALALSPGQHEVSLNFRPASFRWGAAVSIITILLAAFWLAVHKPRGARGKQNREQQNRIR